MFKLLTKSSTLLVSLLLTAVSADVGVVTEGTPIIANGQLSAVFDSGSFSVSASAEAAGGYLVSNGDATNTGTGFSFVPVNSTFEKTSPSINIVYGHLALASDTKLQAYVVGPGSPNSMQDATIGMDYISDDSGQLLYFWSIDTTSSLLTFLGSGGFKESNDSLDQFAVAPITGGTGSNVTFTSVNNTGHGEFYLKGSVATTTSATATTTITTDLSSYLAAETATSTSDLAMDTATVTPTTSATDSSVAKAASASASLVASQAMVTSIIKSASSALASASASVSAGKSASKTNSAAASSTYTTDSSSAPFATVNLLTALILVPTLFAVWM